MRRALLLVPILTTAILSACGGGNDTPKAMASTASIAQFPQNTDMWAGLGGDVSAPAAISKVVDGTVSELLMDPKEAPYFVNIGEPGHDTVGRLRAYLNLQFKTLFGGPFSYPGQAAADDITVMCDDMVTAHSDVDIPGCVFDQFITDVAAVMKTGGAPDGYISRVAPVLTGLKSTIVSTMP